jgi:hypothetical protein
MKQENEILPYPPKDEWKQVPKREAFDIRELYTATGALVVWGAVAVLICAVVAWVLAKICNLFGY